MAEMIYLSGKTKWCRCDTPNDFGDYKLDLYPNDKSLNEIMKLKAKGLKNVLKKDEIDGPFMAFKRPTQKLMKGRLVAFGPPVKVDKNGNPTTDIIGNGSDVTIKLQIYNYRVPGGSGSGVGARWESIRIDNLVPFNPQTDYIPNSQSVEQVKGLAEQPPQTENF